MDSYFKYSDFLKQKFGCPVRKITIDGGFTCPNRDGTLSRDGCIFCDNHSFSPALSLRHLSVADQISHWIGKQKKKETTGKFLAYFQPFTNTHKSAGELAKLYRQALGHPEVVGILIGTRPDALDAEKIEVIADLARECYVSLEIGVQSIFDRTLQWMNRGHDFKAVERAASLCRGRGIDLCFHVILGLPDESANEVRETARALAGLDYQSIKIHHLHVVRHTKLEELYYAGRLKLLTLKEYAGLVADFLEHTPSTVAVQRLQGDAAVEVLVAPEWGMDKQEVIKAVLHEFEKRKTRQGVCVSRD